MPAGRQVEPTAWRTRPTKRDPRAVDRVAGHPLGRGDGQPAAQLGVVHHPGHGGGEAERLLVVQHQAGVADRLGNGRHPVGDHRDPVAHGLDQGHAEALVVGGADEDVGRRRSRPRARPGSTEPVTDDGVGQPEPSTKAARAGRSVSPERRADQVEPGPGVVEAAVDGEHLDQVVGGLVRGDLAHEEQVGPAGRLGRRPAGPARAGSGAAPVRSCR